MKKQIIFGVIILLLFIVCGFIYSFAQPNGNTLESREKQLLQLPKEIEWQIIGEEDVDGYIVSTIVSAKYDGIAVFEPLGKGKYKCRTTTYKPKEEIIIATEYINDKWYNFVWCNKGNLAYAEVQYTVNGIKDEVISIKADSLEMLVLQAPTSDYRISVVYYDKNGNKIE